MKKILYSFSLLLLIFSMQKAHAQVDVEAIIKSITENINAKKYPEAIQIYEQNIDIISKRAGDKTFASLTHAIGACYNANGDTEKALQTYQKAANIRKTALGEKSPEYAKSLFEIGRIQRNNGDYDLAEATLKQVISIRGEIKDKDYGTTVNYLVKMYQEQGKMQEAEELLAQATNTANNNTNNANNTNNNGDYLQLQFKNGQVLEQNGKLDEAAKAYEEIISKASKTEKVYADAATHLASIYYSKGQYDKALLLYRDAASVYQQTLGENTKEYAFVAYNLAVLAEASGNYGESEQMYIKAINIQKQVAGESNINFAYMNSDLAGLYIQQKRYKEAEPLLLTSLEIYKENQQIDPESYANVLSTLTFYYYLNEQYTKANEYQQENMVIRKQLYGEDSPEYAYFLKTAADMQANVKNDAEAEKLYNDALAILKAKNQTNTEEYASLINNLGELYENQNRIAEAKKFYEEALKIRSTNKNTPEYMRTLSNIASLLALEKNYEQAKNYFVELETLIKSNDPIDNKLLANAQIELAGIYYELGDINQSETNYQNALSTLQALDQKDPAYVNALDNLATLYKNKGRYQEAEALYLQALQAAEKFSSKSDNFYMSILDDLTLLYKITGRYQDAETKAKESLELRKQYLGEQHPDYATSLSILGQLYTSMGKYSEAETMYSKAIQIKKNNNADKTPEYATLQNLTAGLYKAMGRYQEAEALLQNAIKLRRELLGEKHPDYATTLNDLATLYKIQNRNAEAAEYYKQALEIRKATLGEKHPDYATSLDNLATFYFTSKQYTEAEPYYKQALEIRKAIFGEKSPYYAASLNNLALLYENTKKVDLAQQYYDQALKIFETVLGQNHPDYIAALNNIAAFYENIKQYDKAAPLYQKVIQLTLDQIGKNFASLSEEEKRLFYESKRFLLDNFVLFAINQAASGNEKVINSIIGDLYNLQLATKGMLLNATSKVRKRILNSGDANVIQKYQDWQNLKDKIASLYSLTPEELKKKNVNIAEMEQQANQLEKEIASLSEDFANAYSNINPTWQQVQEKLEAGEAALEIIRINPVKDTIAYVALLITKDSELPKMILFSTNGKDLENKYLSIYRNSIKNQTTDKLSYTQFWRPLRGALKDIKRVFISPDGVYNQVNLYTLENPDNVGKFVLDEIDIQIVTNTKDLLDFDNKAKLDTENLDMFLIGNPLFEIQTTNKSRSEANLEEQQDAYLKNPHFTPLPGTEAELKEIRNIAVKNNVKIANNYYIAIEANEVNMKKVSSPDILHTATHGFFFPTQNTENENRRLSDGQQAETKQNNDNPMLRSGLVLAGVTDYFLAPDKSNKTEDNLLTAYEVSNLSLDDTYLVVLSACETGLGKVQSGEGVYGLQRGFKIAGAKTIMMSLWKVNDDATKELMIAFYNALFETKDKQQAYQAAIKQMREKYKKPYYWGAFILVGE